MATGQCDQLCLINQRKATNVSTYVFLAHTGIHPLCSDWCSYVHAGFPSSSSSNIPPLNECSRTGSASEIKQRQFNKRGECSTRHEESRMSVNKNSAMQNTVLHSLNITDRWPGSLRSGWLQGSCYLQCIWPTNCTRQGLGLRKLQQTPVVIWLWKVLIHSSWTKRLDFSRQDMMIYLQFT